MKIKNVLALTIYVLFILITPVSQSSYVMRQWSQKEMDKAADTVTIIYTDYEDTFIMGAGVMIAPDGTTLTVAHLFEHEFSTIVLKAATGNTYKAELLAIDPRLDLAIVRPLLSAQKFKFSTFAWSNRIRVGQDVLVIGHPHFYYYARTSGLVDRVFFSLFYLGQILDVTAAVNPGNSGGPVFDETGHIIGIVSAMRLDEFGCTTGIGVAIAVSEIKTFVQKHRTKLQHPPKLPKRYRLQDIK